MNLTINELERRLYTEGRSAELAELHDFIERSDAMFLPDDACALEHVIDLWPVCRFLHPDVIWNILEEPV